MPQFRVLNERGYWDGAKLHQFGTVLEIDPPDYDRLLSNAMEGVDEAGKKALVEQRRKWAVKDANGNLVSIPPYLVQKSGDLDPNDRDDLKALTPRGAKVVSLPTAR